MEHDSKDHHYVPAFYLRGWEDSAGKLWEFKKGDRYFGQSQKSAKATGYHRDLYSYATETPHRRNYSLESGVLKDLDERAAKVLRRLLSGDRTLDPEARTDWARFLIAQLIRTPQDIAAHQRVWNAGLACPPRSEEDWYQAERSAEDPETLAALYSDVPAHELDAARAEALRRSLTANRSISLLSGLSWRIRHLETARLPLMTSDRAVVLNHRLGQPDGFLFLPLSPSVLFMADRGHAPGLSIFRHGSDNEVMRACNRAVVTQAQQYVWASTDQHAGYVKKWIGTAPQRRAIGSDTAPPR